MQPRVLDQTLVGLAITKAYSAQVSAKLKAQANPEAHWTRVGKFLVPNYSANIGMFTFFGELLLMLWLLWAGVRGFDRKPVV